MTAPDLYPGLPIRLFQPLLASRPSLGTDTDMDARSRWMVANLVRFEQVDGADLRHCGRQSRRASTGSSGTPTLAGEIVAGAERDQSRRPPSPQPPLGDRRPPQNACRLPVVPRRPRPVGVRAPSPSTPLEVSGGQRSCADLSRSACPDSTDGAASRGSRFSLLPASALVITRMRSTSSRPPITEPGGSAYHLVRKSPGCCSSRIGACSRIGPRKGRLGCRRSCSSAPSGATRARARRPTCSAAASTTS